MGKEVHLYIAGGTTNCSLLNAVWRLLRKLGTEPPFDPFIPLFDLYPKNLKSTYYSDTDTSMFIAAQFAIAKIWNQPRCPSTHTRMMEYYSTLKNEIISFVGKWMELENIMLTEISQTQKIQRPNVFSDMWILIHNKG